MAAHAAGEVVKAPGTLVVSTYPNMTSIIHHHGDC